jgi:Ni,Fe-hydrogenase I cytochrome b subunit
LDYRYIVLVVLGLAMAIGGFIMNGRSEGTGFRASLLFLAGMIALTLGILLTNVPGFFSG